MIISNQNDQSKSEVEMAPQHTCLRKMISLMGCSFSVFKPIIYWLYQLFFLSCELIICLILFDCESIMLLVALLLTLFLFIRKCKLIEMKVKCIFNIQLVVELYSFFLVKVRNLNSRLHMKLKFSSSVKLLVLMNHILKLYKYFLK